MRRRPTPRRPTSETLKPWVELEAQCGDPDAIPARLAQHLARAPNDAAAWCLLGDQHAEWVERRFTRPDFDPQDADAARSRAARRTQAVDAWERCLALDFDAHVATAERLGDAYSSLAGFWRIQPGGDAAIRARVHEARRWSIRQRLCEPYALPPCTVERPTSTCCPADPSSPSVRAEDEATVAGLGPVFE